MKTLLYCHHSLGMGHLVRTTRLAEALLAAGPVALIVGGELPGTLDVDARLEVCRLPPLRMTLRGSLVDANGGSPLAALLAERTAMLKAFARKFRADALIIEMFPFGRKKLADEILGLIGSARASGTQVVFSSVRDILVTSRDDQHEHDRRAARILNDRFDAVLVHADPAMVRLDATFSAAAELSIPVIYTGFVSSPDGGASYERRPRIVVSAGGGRVGQQLLDTAIAAYRLIAESSELEMLAVTGPLGAAPEAGMNGPAGLRLCEYEPRLPEVLARSRLSISQCGYNTMTDLLRARTPAIFIPFETAEEDEQLRRARLIEKHIHARLIRQCELTPEVLAEAIAGTNFSYLPSPYSLDGARNTCRIVREAVNGQ